MKRKLVAFGQEPRIRLTVIITHLRCHGRSRSGSSIVSGTELSRLRIVRRFGLKTLVRTSTGRLGLITRRTLELLITLPGQSTGTHMIFSKATR